MYLCKKSKCLTFCCGFNNLVDQKQQFIVFLGSTISWNSKNVDTKSMNLLLAVITTKLFICGRLVLYVQGSTFMGMLYFGFCGIFWLILLKPCQIFILHLLVFLIVCSSLIFVGFFVQIVQNPTLGMKTFKFFK